MLKNGIKIISMKVSTQENNDEVPNNMEQLHRLCDPFNLDVKTVLTFDDGKNGGMVHLYQRWVTIAQL